MMLLSSSDSTTPLSYLGLRKEPYCVVHFAIGASHSHVSIAHRLYPIDTMKIDTLIESNKQSVEYFCSDFREVVKVGKL